MAHDVQYNYNPTSPHAIFREQYTNVGSSENHVGKYPYAFSYTSFKIWDAATGGSQLVEGDDYIVERYDRYLSIKSGFSVYGAFKIINPAYQSGDIWIDYDIIESYNAAAIINDLKTRIDTIELTPVTPQGYLYGYEINNNVSDLDHDIDIQPGIVRNSDNDGDIILTLALTKQLDAAWSEGNNQGGLDAGTIAADTFYYIFAIFNTTTLTTDILFSISKTSPTMPSGYTKKRRIRGFVLTNNISNIREFYQKDDFFRYKTFIRDLYIQSPGTIRNLLSVSIAPNFLGNFIVNFNNAENSWLIVGNPSESDIAPSSSYCIIECGLGGHNSQSYIHIVVDSNSQIFYRSSDGVLTTSLQIFTLGFMDRG